MKGNPVEAIATADWHITLNPPISRSVEANWFDVMERSIKQLKKLQYKYNGAPILIAGDIWSYWYSSAEVISWLISQLKGMKIIAIPGNHDIPNHNYLQLFRSAYWTLVEAEVIQHLTPGGTTSVNSLNISPFPFSFPVTPCNKSNGLALEVALVHDYIWKGEAKVPNAPDSQSIKSWRKKLKGYDIAVFGDNHIGFHSVKEGKCTIVNCGSLLRTNIDQQEYEPFVTLIRTDGSIEKKRLDTEGDQFIRIGKEIKAISDSMDLDLSEVMEQFKQTHSDRHDLMRVCLTWAESHNVPEHIKSIMVRSIMEGMRV